MINLTDNQLVEFAENSGLTVDDVRFAATLANTMLPRFQEAGIPLTLENVAAAVPAAIEHGQRVYDHMRANIDETRARVLELLSCD